MSVASVHATGVGPGITVALRAAGRARGRPWSVPWSAGAGRPGAGAPGAEDENWSTGSQARPKHEPLPRSLEVSVESRSRKSGSPGMDVGPAYERGGRTSDRASESNPSPGAPKKLRLALPSPTPSSAWIRGAPWACWELAWDLGGLPLLAAGVVGGASPTPSQGRVAGPVRLPRRRGHGGQLRGLVRLERYSAGAMASWLFLIPLFGVIAGGTPLLGERWACQSSRRSDDRRRRVLIPGAGGPPTKS